MTETEVARIERYEESGLADLGVTTRSVQNRTRRVRDQNKAAKVWLLAFVSPPFRKPLIFSNSYHPAERSTS
jgi:hypothetical protein